MADKNLPNIPIYIGDWERDCNVLSLQAEMAWMKIIFKMHLSGKQSQYKISAKGLQRLWKCDANEVQEILDELLFEDICEVTEIKGGYVFLSRRLEKENQLSETRSKVAKDRWKKEKSKKPSMQTSSKSVQNTDNDIDNDSESEVENERKGGAGGKTENQFLIDLEILKKEIQNEFTWKETIVRNTKEAVPGFDLEQLEDYLEIFFKTLENDGEEEKSIKDLKKHFSRWLTIELKKTIKDEKSTGKPNSGISDEYRRKTAKRLGLI